MDDIDLAPPRVNVGAMDDDLQRQKDDPLLALTRQDLDRFSLAELDQRIEILEAEIVRTRMKREGAAQFRSAADSLFRR